MTPRTDDLIVRAAQRYHNEHWNIAAIAAELGVSPSTVSRLLADARSRGIVEFRVRDPRTEPFGARPPEP